jgi:hypothetical protein
LIAVLLEDEGGVLAKPRYTGIAIGRWADQVLYLMTIQHALGCIVQAPVDRLVIPNLEHEGECEGDHS